MKSKIKNKSGFTLIELLVVIAIIGTLASVITLALQTARKKARDAKRAGDVRQMVTALEQYRIARGIYPTGTNSIASFTTGAALDDPGSMDGGEEPMIPNYIPMFPVSPVPADGSCSSAVGRGNNNYWYDVSDDGINYTLTFCIGVGAGEYAPGTHIATPNGIQ